MLIRQGQLTEVFHLHDI